LVFTYTGGTKFRQPTIKLLSLCTPFQRRGARRWKIYLETAVFVFHISGTNPESSGQRELRVPKPCSIFSSGFWLAPSANNIDAPYTRVSQAPRAFSANRTGKLALYIGKYPLF
jgi:hypothetical protein